MSSSFQGALTFPQSSPNVYESNGDFSMDDSILLHSSSSSRTTNLYAHQDSLAKLPIPKLEETLDKLVDTVLPLARNEYERSEFVRKLSEFQKSNLARTLQSRLEVKRDVEYAGTNASWLSTWWNTLGYLQVRDSVVIHVSYFFHFVDDGSLVGVGSDDVDGYSRGVLRACSLLNAVAYFRKSVISGSLPPERIRSTPLCASAYKYMFHSCRVPKLEQDSYRIYNPLKYNHVVVARKGYFFALDFVDKETQDPLPSQTLAKGLQRCIEMADELETSSSGQRLKLGYFTTSNRDDCAKAREMLIEVGGNRAEKALELLESGAVMICLDDEEPVSKRDCAKLFLHGGSTSGYNRWFDKSIQIIVCKNGKAGLNGEHSMMDGMPVVNFANALTKARSSDLSFSNAKDCATIEPIDIFATCMPDFLESSKLEDLLKNAKHSFTELTEKHDIHDQSFHIFGSAWIKKSGFSPDAFVQLAMHLATFRLFKEQGATYEATQVRMFKYGRTETTRTVSPASKKFIEKMGFWPRFDESDDNIRKEKLKLLKDAATSHVNFLKNAAGAKGVDRHMLGLSLLIKDGETSPEIFSDELYCRAKHWRVSTSNLSHPRFDNWGYGEVVPDGVGLSYNIKRDSIIFNITALKDRNWTERLSHLLEESLLEMKTLCNTKSFNQSKL
eukprot:CAMPEP_0116071494 /NCGR_PEP_ID=MMETSP0322-20121206/13788_1 /TAXON_ID=163516 /ORGANISM="Leptocylindrus danicus var. apora, Strain B651" /LENGTH=669 /DNA_ID=CAMNT_0003559803 /DNA_START=87 /DNA_END=2096 /DNA_ORIENTATION=+